MKPTRVNSYEAVLIPFWDSSLTQPDRLDFNAAEGVDVVMKETWCSTQIMWVGCVEGRAVGTLRCARAFDLSRYDTLVLAASIEAHARVSISVTYADGRKDELAPVSGTNSIHEYSMPLHADHMTSVSFTFFTNMDGAGVLNLYWLGASDSRRESEFEPLGKGIDPAWPGLLKPLSKVDVRPPMLGLFFGGEDLSKIRAAVTEVPLLNVMNVLRARAAAYSEVEPEDWIDENLILHDRKQFIRTRHNLEHDLALPARLCAFVGIIDGDPELLRRSVRFLLCMVHCEKWCESFMTEFPGSSWRHASFTESIAVETCSMVVDWAHGALTSEGRNIVVNRMYDKGLSRIEREFFEGEYYWYENPAMVFVRAQALGMTLMAWEYPRLMPDLLELEQNIGDMFDRIVDNDGGTKLSATYWNKKIGPALTAMQVLQQRRVHRVADRVRRFIEQKKLPKDKPSRRMVRFIRPIVTRLSPDRAWRLAAGFQNLMIYGSINYRRIPLPKLDRLHRYVAAMLSTAGPIDEFLPIGDRTASSVFVQTAITLSRGGGGTFWQHLSALLLHEKADRVIASTDAAMHAVMFGCNDKPPNASLKRPSFSILKQSGHMTSVRRHDGGDILFHLSGVALGAQHSHEDVGSIVLEAYGETVLCDRGSPSYANPLSEVLKLSSYHNLATPRKNGCDRRQDIDVAKCVIPEGSGDDGSFEVSVALSDVWERDLNFCNRVVKSPSADLYLLTDNARSDEPVEICVHFHTPGQVARLGRGVEIRTEQTCVLLVPEWADVEIHLREDSVDYADRVIQHITFVSPVKKAHKLITKITLQRSVSSSGLV